MQNRLQEKKQKSKTDILARVLFLTLLFVAPWPLGGVLLSTQWILFSLLALIALLALPGHFREKRELPPIALWLLLALMFVTAQAFSGLRAGPTSFFPSGSCLALMRLLFGVISFFLGWRLFARFREQQWLWVVLAVSGAAQSFVGIVQRITWSGKLLWTYELTQGGHPFASWVCRNNAGLYLNFCLAGALGLLVAVFNREKFKQDYRSVLPRARGEQGRIDFFLFHMSKLNFPRAATLLLTLLIFLGISGSFSRGAALGTFCGLLALAVLKRRVGVTLISATVLFFGGGFLFDWLGFAEPLNARFDTEAILSEGDFRIQHWLTAMQAFLKRPLWGFGSGAYRYAYLSYETRFNEHWFFNADNQYVEWLVEGGLFLFSIAIIVLYLLCRIGIQLLRNSRRVPAESGIGIALLYAVVSCSVSAFFDFGITLAANFLTLACIAGAACAAQNRYLNSRAISDRGWLFPLLVVSGLFCLPTLFRAANAENAERAARIEMSRLEKTRLGRAAAEPEVIDKLIRQSQQALTAWPGNAELQLRLGRLLIHRYRLAFREAVASKSVVDPQAAWQLSNVTLLHGRVVKLEREGQRDALEALRKDPHIEKYLLPAAHRFEQALIHCPLIPVADYELARLNPILGRHDKFDRLTRAVQRAPSLVDTLYQVGVIAFQEHRDELSFNVFRRHILLSIQGNSTRYDWVKSVTHLRKRFSFEEILSSVFPQEVDVLHRIAEQHPRYSKLADDERLLVRKRLLELLEGSTSTSLKNDFDYAYVRAKTLKELLRPLDAIEWYRTAIENSPNDVEIRLEFIDCLTQVGQIEKATEAAVVCRNMFPERKGMQELVEKLVHLQVQGKNDDGSNSP